MKKRIYIAGPISKGDLAHNIRQAEAAFFSLLKAGFAPFCPHWSCYSNGPKEWDGTIAGKALDLPTVYAIATSQGGGGCGHDDWLGVDLAWVSVSDAVLRLPGESKGADMEVSKANELGIPVFASVGEVAGYFTEDE